MWCVCGHMCSRSVSDPLYIYTRYMSTEWWLHFLLLGVQESQPTRGGGAGGGGCVGWTAWTLEIEMPPTSQPLSSLNGLASPILHRQHAQGIGKHGSDLRSRLCEWQLELSLRPRLL